MKIGVLGAGLIGRAFAMQAVKAGHELLLSNKSGGESLDEIVRMLGKNAKAVTMKEASTAEVIFLAVPWQHIQAVVSELPELKGKIIIDATNPIINPGFKIAELNGKASSEVVAAMLPDSHLVKAFNTLRPDQLMADPEENGGKRVIFISGDESSAKEKISALIESMGFAAVDVGGLATGGKIQQFPGGSLPALNLLMLPMDKKYIC